MTVEGIKGGVTHAVDGTKDLALNGYGRET